MERIEKLAVPKVDHGPKAKTYETTEPLTKVAKSSINYEITVRTAALAAPVQRRVRTKYKPNEPSADDINEYDDEDVEMFTYNIPQFYRHIKTRGYVKLAEPKAMRSRKKYVKGENEIVTVEKKVRKTEASERTRNLAKQKKDFSESPKADPFVVPKKALVKPGKKQAKHLAKLAEPRLKTEAFVKPGKTQAKHWAAQWEKLNDFSFLSNMLIVSK